MTTAHPFRSSWPSKFDPPRRYRPVYAVPHHCRAGWLQPDPADADARPRPCQYCRPHLYAPDGRPPTVVVTRAADGTVSIDVDSGDGVHPLPSMWLTRWRTACRGLRTDRGDTCRTSTYGVAARAHPDRAGQLLQLVAELADDQP